MKKFIQVQEQKIIKLKADAETDRMIEKQAFERSSSFKDVKEKEELQEELNERKKKIADLQQIQQELKSRKIRLSQFIVFFIIYFFYS